MQPRPAGKLVVPDDAAAPTPTLPGILPQPLPSPVLAATTGRTEFDSYTLGGKPP